jgi:hypothetical protein
MGVKLGAHLQRAYMLSVTEKSAQSIIIESQNE